jgi:ATP-binding cassette subfamily C protein
MFGRARGADHLSGRSELASAIHDCRRALLGIVVFSGVMNLLTLTGPLFMLQIYDRVVPSQSIPTLIGLGVIVLTMYATFGFLDQVRARILLRVGAYVDEVVHPKVFKAIVTMPLRNALPGDGLQPLRDLDQIRSFISGGGPSAFSDLPFLPFQIIICFLIDPLIGYAVICGAVVIFFRTISSMRRAMRQRSARRPSRRPRRAACALP